MTVKQTKYLSGLVEGKTKKQAALDAGYAESTALTASQNIESDLFKSRVDVAFEEKGLSLRYLIDKLVEGLEANQLAPNWYRFQKKTDWVPDHRARLQYLIIALRLWKLL